MTKGKKGKDFANNDVEAYRHEKETRKNVVPAGLASEGVDRMFKVMMEHNLYEPLYFPPYMRPNSVLLYLLNLQRIEYWDTVSKYLNEHYSITNSKAREITGVNDTIKMSRLLKLWVSKGLLEKIEKGFKGHVYYKKVGVDIPNKFDKAFARGGENGTKGFLFS